MFMQRTPRYAKATDHRALISKEITEPMPSLRIPLGLTSSWLESGVKPYSPGSTITSFHSDKHEEQLLQAGQLGTARSVAAPLDTLHHPVSVQNLLAGPAPRFRSTIQISGENSELNSTAVFSGSATSKIDASFSMPPKECICALVLVPCAASP